MEFWKIEVFGILSSIFFVYFNAREKLICWPFGILSSLIYIYIFYGSRLYGDSFLQLYYLIIGIYGWYSWSQKDINQGLIPISILPRKYLLLWLLIGVFLTPVSGLYLDKFTNSDVPYIDGLTTVFSFLATWMMTRKYLQNWIIWIVVDLVSTGLYIYKDLYLTSLLFFIYTAMAVYGFFHWKKILN
jgi:nicotinamide mononucleotide transporter